MHGGRAATRAQRGYAVIRALGFAVLLGACGGVDQTTDNPQAGSNGDAGDGDRGGSVGSGGGMGGGDGDKAATGGFGAGAGGAGGSAGGAGGRGFDGGGAGVGGSGVAIAGDCVMFDAPQSVRPDCPGYCPRSVPADASGCGTASSMCRYRDGEHCECDGARWRCGQTTCDRGNAGGWPGDGCGPCPIVAQPRINTEYGACTEGDPECKIDFLSSYLCRDGHYQFYNSAGPP